jgi:FAD/FMN-containing dehydrogenase
VLNHIFPPVNRRFTFHPDAIFFPKTATDVSSAMKLGAKYKFQVVSRSGGHSYTANGLGGKNGAFVVDMRNFKTVSVDSNTHVATIGTGNRLGNVALALNNAGRAMPHGTCPYVGIGGHSGIYYSVLLHDLRMFGTHGFYLDFLHPIDSYQAMAATGSHRVNGG